MTDAQNIYTIPRANSPLIDTRGAPTREWYNFFLQYNPASSDIPDNENVAGLAYALGSSDGTVASIPKTQVQGKNSIQQFSYFPHVTLQLVNDVADPGDVKYYGTDTSGDRGYFAISDAFADSANIVKSVSGTGITSFDLTDLADSGTGALLATTFDAKGRKTGTRAATITGTAGRVTVANGDASAGLPTIDLATLSDGGGGSLLRFVRDAWGRISGTSAATTTDLAEGSNLYYTTARVSAAITTTLTTVLGSATGFLQAGAGAILRTFTAKARERVSPEDFGAVGDGVTDDSAALLAAIATGRNVELTQGNVYLNSYPLALSTGQCIIGNNATIKRAAQTTTTTTTTITSGTTNAITVATGTGASFKAGQSINVFQGASYGTQNKVIQSIVGDVITTTTAFVLSAGSPWSGSTVVALSFDAIKTASNCIIKNVVLDGNKANWTKYHWEVTSEIKSAGSYVSILQCYLHDIPGEGIQENSAVPYGAPGNKYYGNTIVRTNGNGIHLSYSTGCQIVGNYISDNTLDTVMGHVGGCITGSANWEKAVISNNYLSNARCGVGQISSGGGRGVLISGNMFSGIALTPNMIANGITSSYAIEAVSVSTPVNDITVIGNNFFKCTGPVFGANSNFPVPVAKTISGISQATQAVVTATAHGFRVWAVVRMSGIVGMTQMNGLFGTILAVTTNTFTLDIDSTTFTAYASGGSAIPTYPRNYIFSCNELKECTPTSSAATINIGTLSGMSITNNLIEQAGNDIASNAIFIGSVSAGPNSILVSGNVTKYGNSGVQITNNSSGVNVFSNTFSSGYTYGVYAGSGLSGVAIGSNVITNDSTANVGAYQGIALNSAAACSGNIINLVQGYCGLRINGVPNCVVQNNTINSGSARSLAIEAGSTLFKISGNVMSKAMTYSATAGAGNFGIATVSSGTTSIAVTHNVGYTPLATDIQVTPTLMGNAKIWWITSIGATTFTITVDTDPGSVTAVFGWRINT